MLQYSTGVMSTSATQLQALSLKSLLMVLTGECIDHSAILGHILLVKWPNTHFNFHSQYSLLLDGLLNILKVEECMNYSHCSPEGWDFYWVLSFCREHLVRRYSYFHTDCHTEYFPVYGSPAAIESITNQNTQIGAASQMDSLRAMSLPRIFLGNAEKISVSKLRDMQSHMRRVRQTYRLNWSNLGLEARGFFLF